MNFSINRNLLLKNLLIVSKAISSKTPIPIFSGIKFELTENQLILIGSDTDISIYVNIDASQDLVINETGNIVLQAKYLIEIIRKVDSEFITFELLDGFTIKIIASNSEFELNGINGVEYPAIQFDKSDDKVTFDANVLKTIIKQTVFSVSTSENRPILTGVNFLLKNGLLEVIATDSYRLSQKKLDLYVNTQLECNIVIPGKSLVELSKSISGDKSQINMYIHSNKVLFEFDNILYQTRLLEGTYPDASRLIPNEFGIEVNVNLHEIYSAIDRASLLSYDRSKNIVKLEIDGSKNNLEILSNSPEIGRVNEYVNINNEIDGSLIISFSARYFMDALKSLDCTNVSISFNSDMKPFIIKNQDDESVTQLILPVRTY